MGIPQAVVDCMFSTLQEAAHRVRTGYGDSSSYYGERCGLFLFMELVKAMEQDLQSGP